MCESSCVCVRVRARGHLCRKAPKRVGTCSVSAKSTGLMKSALDGQAALVLRHPRVEAQSNSQERVVVSAQPAEKARALNSVHIL